MNLQLTLLIVCSIFCIQHIVGQPIQSAILWNVYENSACSGYPVRTYAIGCLNSDCTNCFSEDLGFINVSIFPRDICLPDSGIGNIWECKGLDANGLPLAPSVPVPNTDGILFSINWRDNACSEYKWGYFHPLDFCIGDGTGAKFICDLSASKVLSYDCATGVTDIVGNANVCENINGQITKLICPLPFGAPVPVPVAPVPIEPPPVAPVPVPVAPVPVEPPPVAPVPVPVAPVPVPVAPVTPPPSSPLSISGASNVIVDCDSVPSPSSVTSSGGCGTRSLTYTQTRINGYCPNSYILKRQWTLVDNGGCASPVFKTQTIFVKDTDGPEILGVPADITVEFDNGIPQPPPLSSISASDNCDAASALSPIKYHQYYDSGPNSHTFKLYRTWSSKDRCKNVGAETQVIRVRDTIPPGVTHVPPSCLWPPNKKFYCFNDILDIRKSIIKTTGASQIRFKKCKVEDCNSNTNCPVTNRVDKYDEEDCFIRNHDDLCVRAERFNGKTRRDYYAYFDVVDAANNKVETVINVRVPTTVSQSDNCYVAREKLGRRGKWGNHDHFWDW